MMNSNYKNSNCKIYSGQPLPYTAAKQMRMLPAPDCLTAGSAAYLRSHTVTWEPPVDNQYYLEYSYNRSDWFALNGGNAISLPPNIPETGKDSSFWDELMADLRLLTHDSRGCEISVGMLKALQKRYGAPEPVVLSSVEKVAVPDTNASLPQTVTVSYTNGMSEERPVIWDGLTGRIQEPAYAAPLVSHRADPYIYRHSDGKYYFIASHTDAGHNLDGRYQYLYLILRCADTLEDLTDNSGRYTEKTVYERRPVKDGTMSPHLWAPEIHYIHGNWFIYYTTTISDQSSWRIRPHCLACEGIDPMTSPWIEKGPIRTTVEGDIAFTDFSLDHTYLNHNGKDYLLWAQKTNNISDIFIAELSNPWTVCTPAVCLTHPEYNWEQHGFPVNEGPAVIRHGGKVFLTFSASGTDAMYCMGLLYADEDADLLDAASWTKCPYPVFQSNAVTGYYGPGHNSFTRSTDGRDDLLIYHGRQEERYLGEGDYQPLYDAGRNTYVGKVFWGNGGLPSFSIPGASIAARKEDLTIQAEITETRHE